MSARKVARDTGQIWKADEIAVTSGAKQALFNAALSLFGPGDEVITHAPCWPTLRADHAGGSARCRYTPRSRNRRDSRPAPPLASRPGSPVAPPTEVRGSSNATSTTTSSIAVGRA